MSKNELTDNEREALCVTTGRAVSLTSAAMDRLEKILGDDGTSAEVSVQAAQIVMAVATEGIRDDICETERYRRVAERLENCANL